MRPGVSLHPYAAMVILSLFRSHPNLTMLRRLALLIVVAVAPVWAAVPAMFRGRVVELADQPAKRGLIYVLGKNGSLRKVQVGSAKVEYADELPAKFRRQNPADSLVHGSEVRVEAEENGAGLWRATSIEILRVPGSPPPKEYVPPAPHRRSTPEPTLSKRSAT